MDKSTGGDSLEQERNYFLTYDIDGNNACHTERDIIVNCCGLENLDKPFETVRHKGRKDFFVLYLASGILEVLTDEGMKIIIPGQMITYFPHTPCVYNNERKESVKYYWAHFTGAKAQELVEKCGLMDRGIIDIRDLEIITEEFRNLFQEFSKRDEYFAFLSASLLTAILVKTDRSRLEIKKANTKRNLQHAISYIHTAYRNENISVEYLASLEHLSPNRFRAIFKENMGLSPKEYILTNKMNLAKQLLYQTDLSIKEISVEIGYDDQLYFSRIFRKRTGYTPSEYKRILREKNM